MFARPELEDYSVLDELPLLDGGPNKTLLADLGKYWLYNCDGKRPDHILAYLCGRNKMLSNIVMITYEFK